MSTASAERRAPALAQRLEQRTEGFIHRSENPELTWEQRLTVQAHGETSALFFLLGYLQAEIDGTTRALSRTRLTEIIERALDYAEKQERERASALLHPDAASPAPPGPAAHSVTGTGLCASNCLACA